MFGAIILDMDGLMVDTERLYVKTMREVARFYARQVTDATLAKMMGRGPLESLRIFTSDLAISHPPEEVLALRERMMMELFRTDLVPMPGLMPFLEWARERSTLAIATGSPRKFMDLILTQLAIRDAFAVLQPSDDIARGKPDPEIYLRTVARLGVPADRCIVLEDSENGVRAGRAAGCYVIAVPNEHTKGQDFGAANFIAGSLAKARELIAGLA